MEKGDLILVDWTAKLKDTGEAVETTLEKEAKKLEIFDSAKTYDPRLVAVGDGWVLKGLDDVLLTSETGKNISIELSPEKSFGVRDSSKVRMIPIRKFGEKADQLTIGSEVDIDGRRGIVRFVGSGRVQIDFNHKYAGKAINYNLTVVKKLESDNDKINALIRRRIPVKEKDDIVNIESATVLISIPKDYFMIEGLQIMKNALSDDVFKYIENISKIQFVEEYSSEKADNVETNTVAVDDENKKSDTVETNTVAVDDENKKADTVDTSDDTKSKEQKDN
ncbi:MAG: peptidylprolyl isomerase [Thermoproteota archaeon]